MANLHPAFTPSQQTLKNLFEQGATRARNDPARIGHIPTAPPFGILKRVSVPALTTNNEITWSELRLEFWPPREEAKSLGYQSVSPDTAGRVAASFQRLVERVGNREVDVKFKAILSEEVQPLFEFELLNQTRQSQRPSLQPEFHLGGRDLLADSDKLLFPLFQNGVPFLSEGASKLTLRIKTDQNPIDVEFNLEP